MKTLGRPGNPNDRQHTQNRVNLSKYRRNGKILLIALGYAALATSLTTPVTLAQSESDAEPEVTLDSGMTPADAEAIDAAVDAMPLSSSTILDGLSDAARAEVERICLPVQYQSGAVAYRECISDQLDSQSSSSTPAQVPDTSLSFDEEYAIQQTCQSAGAVDSAAYRACDETELASLAGVPEPALDRVAEDETYAIQLGCYDSQMNDGVRAYRECLNESIDQLLALPRPDLSTLELVERNALQLRCSAQSTGAVAYRTCLLDAVDGATVANRFTDNAIVTSIAQNDSELAPELAPELSPEPAAEPAEPIDLPVDESVASEAILSSEALAEAPVADPTVSTQAIRLPTTERLDQSDAVGGADVLTDMPEETDDAEQPPVDLLTRVQNTITGMDDMTRMLMWTAIGLPILLTLFWLFMRGRQPATEYEDSNPDERFSSAVDTTPHRSSSAHRMRVAADETGEFVPRNRATGQQDNSALSLNDGDEFNFTAQIDELFGKSVPSEPVSLKKDTDKPNDRNPDPTPDVVLTVPPVQALRPTSETTPETTVDQVADPDLDINSDSDLSPTIDPAPEVPVFTDFTLAPATQRDDYLAWLSVQDESKQQTLAIEFLIYWMAYSDERYSPELKKKIFQLRNPGDHDLIKRWTLKQDVHAFAGNLQWLQYNLSTEQHEQIINLLMALLVSENALTPAQNTLLRFLADAFGLGDERLDALYQAGFAQPMPPLPALDNPDWWKRQSADDLKRWDARSVSRQRSEIRYRVALGLPFAEELDSESIMASFKRAARRCQPERFNRLSSREQNLVAKQLEKYEMAAESLLEVSA